MHRVNSCFRLFRSSLRLLHIIEHGWSQNPRGATSLGCRRTAMFIILPCNQFNWAFSSINQWNYSTRWDSLNSPQANRINRKITTRIKREASLSRDSIRREFDRQPLLSTWACRVITYSWMFYTYLNPQIHVATS